MKNFWIRTASAVVYVILFVGAIYAAQLLHNDFWGRMIFDAFLLFVTIGGTFEFYRMMRMKNVHPIAWLGYLASAAVCLGMSSSAVEWYWLPMLAFLLMLCVAPVAVLLQLWHHSENPFVNVAVTLLPAAYIALPMGLMPHINDYALLMPVIIMVWVNDACAYMGGSLIGKHKLWQRHSPGKTWEGCACGLLFCVLAGIFLGPIFNKDLVWYEWVLLALVCSVIGTLGDLAESMLKRSVGVKDSGNIMPGHGGFLDRFDSLLMIVPFVFVLFVML